METISTLGSLMGLSFLSGLRLYSTILAVGLGLRFGFIHLPDSLADLQVLSRWPVLLIAAAVFAVEFLADKIPWVDSAWDTIHTLIRPVGAAILASSALGTVDPAIKVSAMLLCGTVALASHSAKAGTRLAANHSPEPLSNIGLSLAEDGVVVGGAWVIFAHPIATLVIVIALLAVIIYAVPRLFRLFKRNVSRIGTLFGGRTASHDHPR